MIQLENNKRVLEQWAQNQRVLIDGFDPGTRVEFSVLNQDTTPLPVAAYEEEGKVYALVPNILLQEAGYIRVRVRQPSGSSNSQVQKNIRVVQRQKPEDYAYSETPLLMTADEMFEKIKADPTYAALLDEITDLREQCKKYALLCNQILQDCERIKKEIGGDGQ